MIDHDTDAYYKIAGAFVDGKPSGNLTRDNILDNITLYWLTGTGASAARSYWEAYGPDAPGAGQAPQSDLPDPGRFTTFPGEIWRTPRSWVEKSLPERRLLQRGRQGRALRRVGGAPALLRGDAGRVHDPPVSLFGLEATPGRPHSRARAGCPASTARAVAQLAAAHDRRACAGRSCSSTSGRTRASTGSARSRTCARGPRSTRIAASSSSASTRPSSRSSATSTTSAGRSKDDGLEYPVAIDSSYGVWRAFANHYWPAVYIADAEGGSGTTTSARAATRSASGSFSSCCEKPASTTSATTSSPSSRRASRCRPTGRASSRPRRTSATRRRRASLSRTPSLDESTHYVAPDGSRLNQWALSGEWTIGSGAQRPARAEGRIAVPLPRPRRPPRARARVSAATPVPFRVLVDGEPPGDAHGLDVDEHGRGNGRRPAALPALRQPGPIEDRTFEISFHAPGVEAYVFTFG